MEVDDIVCPETLRYVENQLQTVGSNVRQFCAELCEELLPSSPTDPVEDLNSNREQNASVASYEDSNISVDEDRPHTELIGSSLSNDELQDHDSTANDTSLESIETSHEPKVPSIDKIKFEESCIIVESRELHSLNNEFRKRQPSKRKLRQAFSSKLRLAKLDDKVSPLSGRADQRESLDGGFCESDWEIV
ncbi:uncharacterized protein LOC120205871 [Hibiscus syriacus]|nr:uncharacterized protein LOC120205871 [Hibiscus syriacus]